MLFQEVQSWMHRCARPVDLALWQCLFEDGSAEAVADALLAYQNADGGFGHALEADLWSPFSTPMGACAALNYLSLSGRRDLTHPAYQGLLRYLRSGAGREGDQWLFCLPENDAYPHAPWYIFSEQTNRQESLGVTATLSAFLIARLPASDPLSQRARAEAPALLACLHGDAPLGELGLSGLMNLLSACVEQHVAQVDAAELSSELDRRYLSTIRAGLGHWDQYVHRPSIVVRSPASPLYPALSREVEEELDFLLRTRESGGVWPVYWSWGDLAARYPAAAVLSACWGQASLAINNMLFLRAFSRA